MNRHINCNLLKKTSLVLLGVAALAMTGCGIGRFRNTGDDYGREQKVYPDTTDAPQLTIGYTFWDVPVDGFVEDQANQIKLVAKALNVNLIFNPDLSNFEAGAEVGAAEYFAEQKVDGMIVVNFSDDYLLEINNICEEAKIPFIQATRTINNPDIKKVVEANPYYVGRMHEGDYAAAYEVGRKLIESGAKNILLVAPEHGDTAYEARAEGFRDACEEPDVNIIEETWELLDREETTKQIEELLKKYPEVDGFFAVRCGLVSYIAKAQDNLGYKEYIPVVGVDFDKTMASYMENGIVLAAAGGHHPDASLCLITLVNSIRGAYDKSVYPIDINYSMLTIDSKEAFEDYKKWCIGYDDDFDNGQIINANDARGLCVDFNPEAELEDIRDFAEEMSLDNVKQRHSVFVTK